MKRRRAVAPIVLLVTLLMAGCGRQGLNDLELPGTVGRQAGAYEVKFAMPNVGNLVANNPVRLNDVVVGNVRRIELSGWHALVTVKLRSDVRLSKNVIARVGQASLLGAKYLDLKEPEGPVKGAPIPPGYTVPLGQTGRYPETEDILAAAATLLNGGGLQHLSTISTELNRAMSGRTGQYRDLLTQLRGFVGGLDAQKAEIVHAIDGLDRLSRTLAAQQAVISDALVSVPPALNVLAQERVQLTRSLVAVGDLGDEASRVFRASDDNLRGNIADLQPVLKGLADSGDSLTQSLYLAGSIAFPVRAFPYIFRGDYANLWLNLDLTLPTLDRSFLSGTPLQGTLGAMQKGAAGVLGGPPYSDGNPLLSPFRQEPAPRNGQQQNGSANDGRPPGATERNAPSGKSDAPPPRQPGILGGLVSPGQGDR